MQNAINIIILRKSRKKINEVICYTNDKTSFLDFLFYHNRSLLKEQGWYNPIETKFFDKLKKKYFVKIELGIKRKNVKRKGYKKKKVIKKKRVK